MKILPAVAIFIIFLAVISFLWFVWKKNKDIKDMKKGISDLLVKGGAGRDEAGSGAACYVDKSISGVGYLRFKEIYNGGAKATEKETGQLTKAAASCAVSEYLLSGAFSNFKFS